MKRIWIISLFFLTVLASLCLISCTCQNDVSLTVPTARCDGPFCYSEGKEVTLNGCHINNSCVDCYWFPKANGWYGNEFTGNEFFSGCLPASCVACGFDFTLLECYGYPHKDMGTDLDPRPVVLAVEGADYRIDKFVYSLEDHTENFQDGKLNLGDLKTFVELLNLREAVTIDFYVEYTAFTELHSVEFMTGVQYNHYGDIFRNFNDGFHVKAGNVPTYLGETNKKSKNIQPGKHILTARLQLNAYEILALEDILEIKFEAYTYEEE